MPAIQNSSKRMMMSLISFLCHGTWRFEKAYDTIYKGQNKSHCFAAIVKEAFGDEFPEETETYSFVTATELNQMARHLQLKEGHCLADLACGRGGPGMWLARHTRASLFGVDISKEAVATATRRIPDFDLEGRAAFTTGTFYGTGLKTGSCDGAISVDALWLAPDRARALAEIHRILKPGGRFVFTTWDGNIPFMPADHRQCLGDAGFDVEVYEETRGWLERQLAVYEGVLKSKDQLIREMGKRCAMPIIKEARSTPPVIEKSTRIFVAARKR
ncbi:class I SAM-dependent methyltransferase [Desulfoluna spongiiphila]|uniref:Cyclopropane fatty-acyl-phospholipid synthase n=1 Tax=Desulfoluna spongiiphila TaxID=419481 RepID=A0A1G5F4T8_9BACT|nr:class I SAM-dependent methyltransferase [Desulfoluna spongiiphila]SCY34269.1 Cyclopropane fatty-acyl-phospholipid synthase [Desulfoluna spongiiphila]